MTGVDGLAGYVERFKRSRVLCLGDLMLDRFVYGAAERISPEAPIPVMRVERETAMLGGAGNVVRNLAALGAPCTFVAVIGDDGAAAALGDLLAEHHGVEARLLREADRPSSIKTRYVASGQQLLRADRETTAPLRPATERDVIDAACAAVEGCEVVVLSDYGKGVISEAIAQAVIARARAAGKPVVVDPKGGRFARYCGAAVITPNRAELATASAMAGDGDEWIIAAARKLIGEHELEAVLVTRSRDGMSLIERARVAHVAAEAREVFDVSGAGDTVVAAFAAAIGAGVPRIDAMRLANAAAGIVVGKVGTAAVYDVDLLGALHRSSLHADEAKIMPVAAAGDQVERWRRRGERIGFTNGCFDLLHPGHISLLRQARAHCERLVVGLNSDASAARLKGAGRPVQSQTARALVLASLADVDLVVVFSEDTPLALIERFRPEVLIKGADYRLDQVVGGDLVRGYGGKVVLAELEPGYSTTDTITRLAR